MISRRTWLQRAAQAAGGALLLTRAEPLLGAVPPASEPAGRARKRGPYTPVTTPNGVTLPFRMKDGVKEFHLVAEEFQQEFAPGMAVTCWGYNGRSPGPTIEAVEGDRVRIFVTNRLPEGTSIHWHGIFLPNGMDGVSGLTQPRIPPGETWVYEFTLIQHGTFLYHPHADETVQMALGMKGFFIIHPKLPRAEPIDRDFCLFPHMWAIHPGTRRPDPSVMLDFNIFTLNGRVYPGTDPLVVRTGDRVRLRFANVSMTSHPLHIHGHRFWVVETDGGQIPKTGWWPETTINIPSGTTRAVEFIADAPGDWPLHCHKSHHAMNAMSHDVPNLIGTDQDAVERQVSELVTGYMAMGTTGMSEHAAHAPHMPGVENTLPMMMGEGPFGAIEMGGMFTLLKVRDELASYDGDPGWFAHPPGTVASKVEDPSDLPPTR